MSAEPATTDATECYTTLQTLSARKERAIGALVIGMTDAEAAEKAGVHRVTVTRWRLYDDAFRAALTDRLSGLWETCLFHLRALVPQAIGTIQYVMECGDDRVRLQAALGLMKLLARFHVPTDRGPVREFDDLLPEEEDELRAESRVQPAPKLVP